MSNYTLQVSWSGKDGLSDSDPNKIISGGDFNTEFLAIQTAINSKYDSDDLGVTLQAYDADTAKTDVAQEYTATQNFNATTLSDGATINWDASANQATTVTLAGNRTMAAPTNLKVGTYILRVYQDATGSRTITWNSVFKWTAATAPVLSTTANALDIITLFSDGTNLYGSYLPDMR